MVERHPAMFSYSFDSQQMGNDDDEYDDDDQGKNGTSFFFLLRLSIENDGRTDDAFTSKTTNNKQNIKPQ